MVTILTALRGNPVLTERWATSVRVNIPVKVIAAANNPSDLNEVQAIGGRTIHIRQHVVTDDISRINASAEIYAELIKAADTDFVILWDDDVLPPPNGVARLCEDLSNRPGKWAGVVTVQPYRYEGCENQAVLFWQPFSRAGADMSSIPLAGLHRVWGGGCGFSIWRRESLIKTLPWSAPEDGGLDGWDQDLARKLHELGLYTHVDASIVCRHDHLP